MAPIPIPMYIGTGGPPTDIDVPAGLTRGWWACRCDMIAERMEKAGTPELSRLAAQWRAPMYIGAREVRTKSDGR